MIAQYCAFTRKMYGHGKFSRSSVEPQLRIQVIRDGFQVIGLIDRSIELSEYDRFRVSVA
jgi:hypothetical protein